MNKEITFEEQFPSLKEIIGDDRVLCVTVDEVQEYCLDKQRVKEALDKLTEKHNADEGFFFESHEINDWILDLKEELGLEDE